GMKVAADHSGAVDLLITDLVMPQMNGRELAVALKKTYPALKVLFMSGYASDALDPKMLPPGKSAFLQKPFKPEHLLQYVRQALES
ncbi:MAG TPA: response regulator, partial [Phycisphaerae bacterium]|nr:response regulator [Phycisphaerae bacterium]